ncbi:major facilitator superfamily domain-containing protein, partial [Schizophyllum commune]
TPLLNEEVTESAHEDYDAIRKHNEVYERFSPASKRLFVGVTAFTALMALFVSGTNAVSVSMFTVALGSMTFSSYSTWYGRRPVYLIGLPLVVLGSFGVARSRSVPELFGWRILQALGASPGFSVGSGVIGDIYRLEERGFAMGVFTGAALIGPAFAPVAGGWAAHYSSWRRMQEAIGVAGLVTFVFTASAGRRPHGSSIRILEPSRTAQAPCEAADAAFVNRGIYRANRGFWFGAPLAGKYSDYMVVKWRARRNGVWYPEDRLRAATPGLGYLIPLTLIAFGLTTHFVPGPLGLTLNLIWFFLNGIGVSSCQVDVPTVLIRYFVKVDATLAPIGSYCVDIMHEHSAEAVSAVQ